MDLRASLNQHQTIVVRSAPNKFNPRRQLTISEQASESDMTTAEVSHWPAMVTAFASRDVTTTVPGTQNGRI